MRLKILFLILVMLSGYLFWTHSGMSSDYYTNKAKKIYDAGNYQESIPIYEKALAANPENANARYYYVNALSKSKPNYTVQKKLFEIANSDINDRATVFARSQITLLKKKLLEGVEGNYIFNAISGNNIIHWNLKTFPLKIYYENAESLPSYYKDNINKALNQWTSRTNFVKFTQTNKKQEANIIINFQNYSGNCTQAGCHYTLAQTTPEISGDTLKKMTLTFLKTSPRGEYFSPLEVYNSALHEIGHTLGIMGHSDDSYDVMYSNNDKTKDVFASYRSDSQYLTIRDIRTLALLYRLEPSVTDVKDFNENYYYPPLILGNETDILNKKLKEWENYIIKYPNIASGYINLASVYSDMGEYDKALENLDKAQRIDSSADTAFTTEYNKAVIYYNSKNFKYALVHATQAKAIKNDPAVEELIREINKLIIPR